MAKRNAVSESDKAKSAFDIKVKMLADVQEQLLPLKHQEESLKDELRQMTKGRFGDYSTPAGTLTISPNNRVNMERVKEAYPFEDFPKIYSVNPDLAKFREAFPPSEVNSFLEHSGKPKVSIKVVKKPKTDETASDD